MTHGEGMLQALPQSVERKNNNQIDLELAEDIAKRMLTAITLILPFGISETNNLSSKAVVYVAKSNDWEVLVFENVVDAIVFAASAFYETYVVQDNQCIDWCVSRNKIIYHDFETCKNVVIPA